MVDIGREPTVGRWQEFAGSLQNVLLHPEHAGCIRMLARNMLSVTATDPVLDEFCKDAGRYSAVMWAFYLHASGNLTLPALKDLARRTGFLSPGRARLVLQLLEHRGWLERKVPAAGGPASMCPRRR